MFLNLVSFDSYKREDITNNRFIIIIEMKRGNCCILLPENTTAVMHKTTAEMTKVNLACGTIA